MSITTSITTTILRGLVKLKKSKNPKNTHSSIHFFFETCTTTKKTFLRKKTSCGLTHPPTPEFFSDFWYFFSLTKLLSRSNSLSNNSINDALYSVSHYINRTRTKTTTKITTTINRHGGNSGLSKHSKFCTASDLVF